MLILVIGDLHIPHRAYAIPQVFKDSLSTGKIHQILCTGNLCTKSEHEMLRKFCSDIQMVRGEFDEDDVTEAETVQVTVGSFRIGLASSYTIIPSNDKERLAAKARELDVDILVFGGGQSAGMFKLDNRLYLNPGSATGAFSPENMNPRPSFILINVQGSSAIAYIYTLNEDGTMKVDKDKFSKDEE